MFYVYKKSTSFRMNFTK